MSILYKYFLFVVIAEIIDVAYAYNTILFNIDRFDASCMDFIDDYCDVFDNEDENKFVYTDIHEKFKEHVRFCSVYSYVHL